MSSAIISKLLNNSGRSLLLNFYKTGTCSLIVPNNGLKDYILPPTFDEVEYPERMKLKFMEKVPQYPAGMRPPKMQKKLIYMRGPEAIHNSFIHKQYGIVALQPGRMRSGHFEMVRMTIGRKLDTARMFAIWRIDAPWQPVTRKGQGKRMGGGKGAIDHYVTPVKHGRVIVELGGQCEYKEAYSALREISEKLPFKAAVFSHETLEENKRKEKELEENNVNPYTFKYIVRNNMGRSHPWISPYDRKWFGKHI